MLAFPSLRPKLGAAGAVAGTFCELPCAEAVEIVGLAGFDFVVLDGEHAPIGAAAYAPLVRAAAAAGLPAVIRVASNDAASIQHALDSGAAGVQIPQIASAGEARRAVEAARFHPQGRRGFNPFVRAADFSAQPVEQFFERGNRDVTVVLQVESAAGIASSGEILDVDGFDVLFLGPYDLSQSLGVPGETSHPKVLEAARGIVEAAGRRGIAVGVFSNTADELRHWAKAGVRYLCYSVDTVRLLDAMREAYSLVSSVVRAK
ncbi:MAG: HpcH/HpaI aldolase family protein [Bryobacteraceae bacterium]